MDPDADAVILQVETDLPSEILDAIGIELKCRKFRGRVVINRSPSTGAVYLMFRQRMAAPVVRVVRPGELKTPAMAQMVASSFYWMWYYRKS